MLQLTISQCHAAVSAEKQFTAAFLAINKQKVMHTPSSSATDAKSAISGSGASVEPDFKANLSQPLIAQSFGIGSMVASGFSIHYEAKDPHLPSFKTQSPG